MKNSKIKVEYIYNSGFTIETKNHFLVIDYYKGDLEIPDKNTSFFVTHHHHDHFNPEIFKYDDRANYILSYDVDEIYERESKKDNILVIHPYVEKSFNGMNILALSSTDAGSSFFIELDGINIFHAGDLNWWAWEDSGPEREIEREKEFKSEIDRLGSRRIDLAFIPVDPRLEHNFHLAGEYFINKYKPSYFFPMHFGDNYESNSKFIHKMGTCPSKIVDIQEKNQITEISTKDIA